jgi:hypothetical protein
MTKRTFIIALILILFLSACTQAPAASTPIPPTVEPATAVPPTQTPPPATKVWVVLGNSLEQSVMISIGQFLQAEISLAGWEMEQRPSLTMSDLDGSSTQIRAVVVLPPDPGMAEMAQKYPGIPFMTVGIPGLPDLPNLYSVAPDGYRPEWDGFLAGYLSAILTPEWRIGTLTQAGSPDGAKAAEGFVNGGVLYCGLCLTQYPPFTDYPFKMEMNAGAAQTEWQGVADQFIASGVRMAYLYPTISSPELMSYLAQKGIYLIGNNTPPAELQAAWVATIQTDLMQPTQAAWKDLAAGNPPGAYTTRPQINPGGAGQLSEGKLMLLNKVIDDLAGGVIDPLTVQ